jgi:hypothetical protein
LTFRRSSVGKQTEARRKERARRPAGSGPAKLSAFRRSTDKELILLKIYDPQQGCSRQVPGLSVGLQATAERVAFGALATTVRPEQGNTW